MKSLRNDIQEHHSISQSALRRTKGLPVPIWTSRLSVTSVNGAETVSVLSVSKKENNRCQVKVIEYIISISILQQFWII